MKVEVYINELDQEIEFSGEIMSYGSQPDHTGYSESNKWRVWWGTSLYTAEQNSIIETYEDKAIEQLEKEWVEECVSRDEDSW